MQTDIETFLKFFNQVDKHLRTLVKFLRDFISKCQDPKVIEHNQKQIKTIESLLEDVKKAIVNKDYTGEASRLIESLFLLSSESLKDVQTSAMLSDKERAFGCDLIDENKLLIPKKRKRPAHEGELEMILKQESKHHSGKENNFHLSVPNTQPFICSELESAGEDGTSMKHGGSGLLNGNLSKKRRN